VKIAICHCGSKFFDLPCSDTTEATMEEQEELVIITKTYDLILWSCNHTSRFPRQHRFVLGERLEAVSKANSQFV
jgi:hypothetical protein